MDLKSELLQALAFVGVMHVAAEFLNSPTLKTLDRAPGTEAALAMAAALLPAMSGGGGTAGTSASSTPALVEEYEAACTCAPSTPALVGEYEAAGTSTPPTPALVGGYGGLAAPLAAGVVGFVLGKHLETPCAHRRCKAGPVVEVEEVVVDVEEGDYPEPPDKYRYA